MPTGPQTPPVQPAEGPVGRWCLVANVVDFREWGPERQVRSGTRHFSGGAKVYCDHTVGGDGFHPEFGTVVVGRHRGSGGRNWIRLFMKVHFLHKFRAACEYSPTVRRRLDTSTATRSAATPPRHEPRSKRTANAGNEMAAIVKPDAPLPLPQ